MGIKSTLEDVNRKPQITFPTLRCDFNDNVVLFTSPAFGIVLKAGTDPSIHVGQRLENTDKYFMKTFEYKGRIILENDDV